MKYVSRMYLCEKWESLKWDMEKIIGVYDNATDDVSEEAARVRENVLDKIEAIKKEIGK